MSGNKTINVIGVYGTKGGLPGTSVQSGTRSTNITQEVPTSNPTNSKAEIDESPTNKNTVTIIAALSGSIAFIICIALSVTAAFIILRRMKRNDTQSTDDIQMTMNGERTLSDIEIKEVKTN